MKGIRKVSMLYPTLRMHSTSTIDGFGVTKIIPKAMLIRCGDSRTMRVKEELINSIKTPEVLYLKNIFDKYGYNIRLAGGAVRDILSGIQPGDVDFATTATPIEMKAMLESENIRMLNTNGESHGTITVRINEKVNFEITTLRVDLVTDGRRAKVQFTDDWKLDASRRDLTINSMFLDLEGNLYDYFQGFEDLKNNRIRFVGLPCDRIKEDYLRILRYFRFYGRISPNPDSHDHETLDAIRNNCEGLKNISGERIWTEMKKIIKGRHYCDLVSKMMDVGMFSYIGLPEKPRIDNFKKHCDLLDEVKESFNPVTAISALLRNELDAQIFHQRLKLSVFERDLCFFIIKYRNIPLLESTKPFEKILIMSKEKQPVVKLWIEELFKYHGNGSFLSKFRSLTIPKFPFPSKILIEMNIPRKLFSSVLTRLKDLWIDSDYKLSEHELINSLDTIIKEVKEK